MTELIQTTAPSATPLGQYLGSLNSGSAPALVPYLGALTPQHLDAAEAETEAFLSGAAVHDLGWLRRIAIRGEDRFRWLSGMVTNEVETLADHCGTYNLILNAQGRIQGAACVWRDGDALELEVTAEQSEALQAHLDRFIIMDDVELAPITGQSALGLTGPQADSILSKLGLATADRSMTSAIGTIAGNSGEITVDIYRNYGPIVPHYALWVADEHLPGLWQALVAAGAQPAGAASLETLRIVEGIPAYGIDIQSRDLAQETSQTRALNFTKGCYLGQEIVERIRSRGQVHRHLRSLEVFPETGADVPTVGTELQGPEPGTKSAGVLTSVTQLQRNGERRIFAIAMIRAEAETGNKPVPYPGGTANILHTPPKLQ